MTRLEEQLEKIRERSHQRDLLRAVLCGAAQACIDFAQGQPRSAAFDRMAIEQLAEAVGKYRKAVKELEQPQL